MAAASAGLRSSSSGLIMADDAGDIFELGIKGNIVCGRPLLSTSCCNRVLIFHAGVDVTRQKIVI